jgi:hypothetical protein
MRHRYYILDEKRRIKPVADEEWAIWFEENARNDIRRVDATEITKKIRVSTVFLGLDHNFSEEGEPLLFETMVFGGKMDEYMERYTTYAEAHTGHWRMVDKVRKTLKRKVKKK